MPTAAATSSRPRSPGAGAGPSAKALILDLLSTLKGRAMPVRALVAAAGLFGIAENSVRVTLARLAARGLIERNERGFYGLAPGAAPVQQQVASWEELDSGARWSGSWVGAHTGGLPRKQRRARERAFALLGFRELDPDLWVRPDCLEGGIAGVRGRLRGLGLPERAAVFSLAQLDPASDTRARALWDVAALRAGYGRMIAELEASEPRLASQTVERAMVESFVVGGRCIRALVYDPRLPEPIAPVAERRELVRCMRRYDRVGRSLWSRFMRAHDAPYRDSVMDLHTLHDDGQSSASVGGAR